LSLRAILPGLRQPSAEPARGDVARSGSRPPPAPLRRIRSAARSARRAHGRRRRRDFLVV